MKTPHRRLLVVEDNVSMRESMVALLRNILPDARYKIDQAADFSSAKYTIRSAPCVVASWDLRVPESGDPSLPLLDNTSAQLVAAENSYRPVIVYSGYSDTPVEKSFLAARGKVLVLAKGGADDLEKFPPQAAPETWACLIAFLLIGEDAALARQRKWPVVQELVGKLESVMGPLPKGPSAMALRLVSALPSVLGDSLREAAELLPGKGIKPSAGTALALHHLRLYALTFAQAQTAIWLRAAGQSLPLDAKLEKDAERATQRLEEDLPKLLDRADAARLRFPAWANYCGFDADDLRSTHLAVAARQIRRHRNFAAHLSVVADSEALLPMDILFGAVVDALAYWVDYPFIRDIRADADGWTAQNVASLGQREPLRVRLPAGVMPSTTTGPISQLIWRRPDGASADDLTLLPQLIDCSPWVRLRSTDASPCAELLWHPLALPESGQQKWRTLGFDGRIGESWVTLAELEAKPSSP